MVRQVSKWFYVCICVVYLAVTKLALILFDIAEQGPQPAAHYVPQAVCEPNVPLYIFDGAHFQQFLLLFRNFRIKYVNWLRIIV